MHVYTFLIGRPLLMILTVSITQEPKCPTNISVGKQEASYIHTSTSALPENKNKKSDNERNPKKIKVLVSGIKQD